MGRHFFNYSFLFLLTLLCVNFTPAQQKKKRSPRPASQKNGKQNPAPVTKQSEQSALSAQSSKSRDELIEATRRYKKSLQELIVYHERNVGRATEQRDKLKALYVQGIVSKHELDESERAVEAANNKLVETRASISGADTAIAQIIEESKLAEQLAKAPKLAIGGLVQTVAYVRYNGSANWALSDSGSVQSFFLARFGRSLPVSAFGQTAVHNQLGFDHRNAMDAAVHPDSPEGIALMEYLRRAGIPFIAFRRAVSGSATGPHIHIGRPSHRIAVSPT
jgi:hypothetical protein